MTVDWFHVVQLFTKAVDDVRKAERQGKESPEKSTLELVLKKAALVPTH